MYGLCDNESGQHRVFSNLNKLLFHKGIINSCYEKSLKTFKKLTLILM